MFPDVTAQRRMPSPLPRLRRCRPSRRACHERREPPGGVNVAEGDGGELGDRPQRTPARESSDGRCTDAWISPALPAPAHSSELVVSYASSAGRAVLKLLDQCTNSLCTG